MSSSPPTNETDAKVSKQQFQAEIVQKLERESITISSKTRDNDGPISPGAYSMTTPKGNRRSLENEKGELLRMNDFPVPVSPSQSTHSNKVKETDVKQVISISGVTHGLAENEEGIGKIKQLDSKSNGIGFDDERLEQLQTAALQKQGMVVSNNDVPSSSAETARDQLVAIENEKTASSGQDTSNPTTVPAMVGRDQLEALEDKILENLEDEEDQQHTPGGDDGEEFFVDDYIGYENPATETEDSTTLEAEIAPDFEGLAAEHSAVVEQLQQMEQQLRNRGSDNIVVAEVVAKEDKKEDDDKQDRTCKALLGFIVLVIVVIVIVAVTLTQTRGKSDSDEELSPTPTDPILLSTPPPTPMWEVNTERFLAYQAKFGEIYGTEIYETIENNDRFRALHWLANEDPASLNIETTDFQVIHERYVLTLFYYATKGWQWKTKVNWLSVFSVCRWENINCQGNLEYVREIALGKNFLDGTIPPEVGELFMLDRCDLQDNKLSGTIPSEYGKNTKLQDLSFGSNDLTGTLPSELGNLDQLFFFSCSVNQLNGTIPTEYGNWTGMKWMFFGENNLTGTIPDEFSELPILEVFHLHGNDFTGDISPIVCNATDPTELALVDVVADCVDESEIICSCCRVCCSDTHCCTLGGEEDDENDEEEWICTEKEY